MSISGSIEMLECRNSIMGTNPHLNILFVEDVPEDMELAARKLRKSGFLFDSKRVETQEDFLLSLSEFKPDAIICDYSLPKFDGMHALRLSLEYDDTIPFILFTGSINEDTAVDCMKAGATDYVIKESLGRLPYSVRDALNARMNVLAKEKAELELKKSEERLKLAMEASEHGFWDLDIKTNNIYLSSRWYSMLGYEMEDIPMSLDAWNGLMHPDDRGIVFPQIKKSLRTEGFFRAEIRYLSKSGDLIWVLLKGKTFEVSADGEPLRVVGTGVDITARKEAYEQMLRARIVAEEANRSKSEFLANVSHELRTPLNSIIGYSDVLLDGAVGKLNDKQKQYIGIVIRSGNLLRTLVNNLLNISKIESGTMCVQPSKFDLPLAIEEVQEMTNLMSTKKNIEINVNIDPSITEITADITKIKEVMYNLVENSLKFTPADGTISIRVSQKSDCVKISVIDSGIGIKGQDLVRIFDPFVQVDGSSTRKYGGTGLGLMLVKEYVEMHGGKVWVESEFGVGSNFTFMIPQNPENLLSPLCDD